MQEFIDEQRKFYENNVAGEGYVVKDGRLRASEARQILWKKEKQALIELDFKMNHSSQVPITDKSEAA